MNSNELWNHVEKVKNWVISWIMWGLAIVFPVVLVLLVIQGTDYGLFASKYVQMPKDVMVWLQLAGVYYLIRARG